MEKKIKKIDYNDCPLRAFLDDFGNKWALLLLFILSNEFNLKQSSPMRFGEIHKSILAISQKMLTQTLKSLERDGLIIRKVYPQVPPKVEYTLSPLGESLIPVIAALSEWVDENQKAMQLARKKYKAKL